MNTKLEALFEQWSGENPKIISKLPISGSDRSYFRLSGETKQAIGAINQDIKENRAFIEYSRFLKEKKMSVPEIYAVDIDMKHYLLQDLGNETLFDWLSSSRNGDEIPEPIVSFYKLALSELVKFQIEGKNIDFSVAYPRTKFDKQSMMWDLNYFKYYFLKLAQIHFDEQLLEDDFIHFTDFLLETDTDYFMYRDFQSRNIMVLDNKPYFIDYQGGRKGALQYDLVSLLFDAKADLPNIIRENLFDYYINELQKFINVDITKFRKYYFGYMLIRIMQAMGTYGFRGFYEKKDHFLRSIPFALKNLHYILENFELLAEFPDLKDVLLRIVDSKKLKEIQEDFRLCVNVSSFSYKRGIPTDYTGYGGGFVFDCRCLPNPGRDPDYKNKTGFDKEVCLYLENEPDVDIFVNNVYAMVKQAVNNYLERRFKSLSINFGCTGGQHRSVYLAERLGKYLGKFPVQIKIKHIELEFMNENNLLNIK